MSHRQGVKGRLRVQPSPPRRGVPCWCQLEAHPLSLRLLPAGWVGAGGTAQGELLKA